MDGEIVATGLRFPEGPVWDGDVLYVTEVEGGAIARFAPGAGAESGAGTDAAAGLSPFAAPGGGPNGAALGANGSLWVTQNGGMGQERTTAGIQRVTTGGEVEMVVTDVAGLALEGPNDLAFGPDNRLWFTDPRGAADPARNDRPGRLFAVDLTTGTGDLVAEVGPVFPNGIAFLADGTLVWTESFTRRVMAWRDGASDVLVELPERHFPDGMCVAADGTLYVASTYGHCVSVVVDGTVVDRLMCGDGMVTNCCFAATDLYVTESRHGTLWRFPVGAEGLPLAVGAA